MREQEIVCGLEETKEDGADRIQTMSHLTKETKRKRKEKKEWARGVAQDRRTKVADAPPRLRTALPTP